MIHRSRTKARRAAKELFDRLSPNELWEVGDALVLGYFDWRDYWNDPPPKGTTNELWKLIQAREEML